MPRIGDFLITCKSEEHNKNVAPAMHVMKKEYFDQIEGTIAAKLKAFAHAIATSKHAVRIRRMTDQCKLHIRYKMVELYIYSE